MTQIPDSAGGPSPESRVNGPSLALIILGCVYIAFSVLSLVLNVLGVGLGAAAGGDQRAQAMFQGGAGIAGAILGMVLGAIILLGGTKMRKLQSYGMAMTGTIAAMLPCTCCCIVGLPLGIWSLIILLKPEVKAAFH